MQYHSFTRYVILLACVVAVGFGCASARAASQDLDRKAVLFAPVEWSLDNPTVEGNPFDLDATVTLTHEDGADRISTGMFYAGGTTWKFRFTATRPGRWTFTTASDAKALDGHRGTVTVADAPGSRGFVTGFGSKWGYSGSGEVFVPQLAMYASPDAYYQNLDMIDRDIQTFLVEHGFNGFHTGVLCRWFDLEKTSAPDFADKDPNPDPRTFEALELLITKTYAAGGMVHIWAWGDEQRKQTPIGLGGKNGPADRRLQRYIAARLGPLPGWTMGYGFDLVEWTEAKDLRDWHAYLHEHLGWPHMLGGRSRGPQDYHPGVEFPQVTEGLDYSGYEQHRPTYDAYVAAIDARPGKPSFSEDRFRIRDSDMHRKKDYTMEMTRRGLWHSAMAGGVANIWGQLLPDDGTAESKPYPEPYAIKTYARFFEHRFTRDMTRNNRITDGVCLARPTNAHYVFYKEDADTIRMDLSALDGPQPAVAVDTRKPYDEVHFGVLDAKLHTWTAPYTSDWAIAVGTFGDD